MRIAPVKNSNIRPGVLTEKITEVEKWIRDTLNQIRPNAVPKKFTVVPVREIPRIGNPFDVLWAKFELDENLCSDEAMWDIRYLLMASKIDKMRGFPDGLKDIREGLFISRDDISERKRRARRD